jgi:hypothetical protein
MTEADLAKKVVVWLEENGWDVYQEVQPRGTERAADIVATCGQLVWIVECKMSLGLSVLAQSHLWHGWAHYVSVAVPTVRGRGGRHYSRYYAKRCLRRDGVGLIEVGGFDASEKVKPSLNRRASHAKEMRDGLEPEHKHYAAAGSADGRRWTPFRRTCQRLVDAVKAQPGIQLKDLIDSVDHHYASDASGRACIARLTREGVIDGLRCERVGKRVRFYLDEQGGE